MKPNQIYCGSNLEVVMQMTYQTKPNVRIGWIK